MTGTDNSYSEPDAGAVAYGTDNIFGTIEQAAPAEATEQNADAQADTAETEAQPAQ